jgi:hypothetical protein
MQAKRWSLFDTTALHSCCCIPESVVWPPYYFALLVSCSIYLKISLYKKSMFVRRVTMAMYAGPLQANLCPNVVLFWAQPITKVGLVRRHNGVLSASERFLLNADKITRYSMQCNQTRDFMWDSVSERGAEDRFWTQEKLINKRIYRKNGSTMGLYISYL